MSTETNHIKLRFHLVQDEDGYPPFAVENLWAMAVDEKSYQIDSIPYYVRNISVGDIVAVKALDDILWYDKTICQSCHSTIRVLLNDENDSINLRKVISDAGCHSEVSNLPCLIAVDVPDCSSAERVAALLVRSSQNGMLEFEISSSRHEAFQ